MKKKYKTGTLVCMVSALAIGLTVTFSSNGDRFVKAEGCQHVGNHYSGFNATITTSGVREYWVCCSCHEHFLVQPMSGSWTDAANTPNITDNKDDRYIPKLNEPDTNGFTFSEDGTTITGYTGKETTVTIPEGVTAIAEGAFEGNKEVQTVIIPEGVTEIGNDAFKNSSVTTVTIPDTVTTIGNSAFENSNVSSITLPDTVTEIGKNAFQDCENLHKIVIPSSVEEIGSHAFFDKDKSYLGADSSVNDIMIFLEITEAELKQLIKDGKVASDWNDAYESTFLGFISLGNQKARVYYKGEWKYDQGVPLPTVLK